MATVTTTIRVDENLKKEATKLAKEMWLTFNVVVNNYLRDFLKERKITFVEHWRETVVDLGEEGVEAKELLDVYQDEYGQVLA